LCIVIARDVKEVQGGMLTDDVAKQAARAFADATRIKQISRDEQKVDPAIARKANEAAKKLALLLSAAFPRGDVKTREGTAEVEVGGVEKTQLAD
jgi:hypothetical protein